MLVRQSLILLALLLPIGLAHASPPPSPPTPPSKPFVWSFELGRGLLGVEVSSMTPELRAFFGAPSDTGLLVQKVESGSVAEKAGLAVGDVLIEVDGDRITRVGDVRAALADRRRGDSVEIAVIRKNERRALVAVLEEDPSITGVSRTPFGDFTFGATRQELHERLADLERRLETLEGRATSRSKSPPPAKKRPLRQKKGSD